MQKTVALDIGGVCLDLQYDKCLNYFGFKPGDNLDDFRSLADQYERGMISDTQWLSKFREYLGRNISDEDICYGWNLIIGNDMPGMVQLIREMTQDGYRFIYFSDTSQLHLFDVYRKFSAAHLISGGIFSFEIHAKKPEAAMYQAFEEKYGKPVLYLDDRLENIAGGKEYGWNSHLFTGIENLRKTLSL